MTPYQRIQRSSSPPLLVTGALALGLAAGCAEAGSTDPGGSANLDGAVAGDFIAHVSPKSRTITFEKVGKAPAGKTAPGFRAQDLNGSADSLNIESDDVEGSGSTNTVELVTNSVGFDTDCPPGFQSKTFCGNVTLRHFYPRSLSHVYVQATRMWDTNGNDLTGHSALNSDASEFGLNNGIGLWQYSNEAAASAGVLGAAPYNHGTRDWVFQNPDDADWYIYLKVVAGMQYLDYAFDFSSESFIDACALGTNLGKTSTSTQTLPFTFTLYDQTSTTVRFNRRGMMTFGSTAGSASGTNVALPSTAAPKPALFAFWDDIVFGTNGAMCFATVGEAPNRKFVVEWRDMNFASSGDQTASLTFEAILSEGTNSIDTVYHDMNGPTLRASGDSATVGVQNSTGTAAQAEYNIPDFGSGNAYAFIPIP